jgi:pimeloyl-ACP methyl ester carboxylesterase
MHIIDWVYQSFGSKLDIRAMWVGGHSWGAFYTAQFGCDARIADKVKGLIIMSGPPTLPVCWSVVSLIDTNAEMDIGPPLDQGTAPMSHGCQAMMTKMDGNNTETFWPGCSPGFVHANYLMLGKMHIDFMDDEVVHSIVDWIKLARR